MNLYRAIGWAGVTVFAIVGFLAFCGWWGNLIRTLYGGETLALPVLFSPFGLMAGVILFFLLCHKEPS